ncbi:MAG: M20/M25/M40 family metallo-hydrolase [Nocardioidaceae bacterium]
MSQTVHSSPSQDTDAQQALMTDHLRALVDAESPSSDAGLLRRCREVLADLGSGLLGVAPQVLPDSGGAVGGLLWRVGDPGRSPVLVVGHLDTVWPRGTITERPFTVSGGRATGPGVFDMKAGLVQGLHALAGLDDETPVALLVTTDEETGSVASREIIMDLAGRARAALVLEGSADGGALKHARKGWSFYDVAFTGRAAHAGLEPHKGINALAALASVVTRLPELGNPDAGSTVTPTVATAGTSQNTVPDLARLTVDVRAWTADEQDAVDRHLRVLIAEHGGPDPRVNGGVNRPPLEPAQSRGLVSAAEDAFAALGLAFPGTAAVGGISDGNLCALAGAPTLDGLGAVGGAPHAVDEWVDLAAMPVRAAVLKRLVADLAADQATSVSNTSS